jgi:Outer membrane protein beta-barrel domain
MVRLGVMAVAATLACAGTAAAQKAPLEVGPVVGINFATLGGTLSGTAVSGAPSQSRTGFAVGVAAMRPLGGGLSVAARLIYSSKGARYTSGPSSFGSTTTYTAKSSYLEVPVMLGYTLPLQGSRLAPEIFAGPFVAVETGCTLTVSDGGGNQSAPCSQAWTNKTFDFGLTVGAGVGVPVESGTVKVVLRYGFGLADIGSGVDAKNRVLGLAVSYLFPLGAAK